MKAMDYRRKLGLGTNDVEKTSRFYAQMHNYFISASTVDFDEITEAIFCNKIGALIEEKDSVFADLLDDPHGLARAWIYLKSFEKNFPELLFRCVYLINSYTKKYQKIKEGLKFVILNALDDCQLPYDLIYDGDEIFIFPKGVQEFDDALVSQPLEWLGDYPHAENAWSKALRDYAEATDDKASDVADKFRKAMETFFQEFFSGSRSLENYKSDYGKYLKEQGVPKEISGNFEAILQAYTNYMNSYAKHRDRTSDTLLEYIMYQTGNIIRLLIVLKQEETTHAH